LLFNIILEEDRIAIVVDVVVIIVEVVIIELEVVVAVAYSSYGNSLEVTIIDKEVYRFVKFVRVLC
jgi:hypothetical protein